MEKRYALASAIEPRSDFLQCGELNIRSLRKYKYSLNNQKNLCLLHDTDLRTNQETSSITMTFLHCENFFVYHVMSEKKFISKLNCKNFFFYTEQKNIATCSSSKFTDS